MWIVERKNATIYGIKLIKIYAIIWWFSKKKRKMEVKTSFIVRVAGS